MRFLTADQNQQRVACEELRQIASYDAALLSRVVTGDESCIYSYERETKHSPAKGKVKSMTIIFFNIKGIPSHTSILTRDFFY
jgi:hypothetical protein